jgi:hypothetical protein
MSWIVATDEQLAHFIASQVVQVLKRVGRLGDQVEQVLLPPLGAATVPRYPPMWFRFHDSQTVLLSCTSVRCTSLATALCTSYSTHKLLVLH